MTKKQCVSSRPTFKNVPILNTKSQYFELTKYVVIFSRYRGYILYINGKSFFISWFLTAVDLSGAQEALFSAFFVKYFQTATRHAKYTKNTQL